MAAPGPPDPRDYNPLMGSRASIENRRKLIGALFGTRIGRWIMLAAVVAFVIWLALR